jgi:hypothetical protein
VITVCSRCKRTISETFEKGSEKKVSHGICTRCLAVLESEIREGTKAGDSHTEPDSTPLQIEEP